MARVVGLVKRQEEIVIARAGEPVARLVPVEKKRARRVAGLDAGKDFWIADDFDDPLPPEIQKHFE